MELSTSYTSAESVFHVAELCELILLYADVGDILRCRRVSKALYKTCSQSNPLRQKLFLEPDGESPRKVCPLIPAFFRRQLSGYRESTIAIRPDMVNLWANTEADVEPLWRGMLISQPPATTCVIPIQNHSLTIYFRRSYPKGMTFGDLQRAFVAAYEIKKGRKSSREKLEELSETCEPALIYWS